MARGRRKVAILLHVTGVVAFSASAPNPPAQQELVRVARATLRADRVDLAMRQALAARLADPSNGAAQSLLGDIAYRKADFDAAESFYLAAVSPVPACAPPILGPRPLGVLDFPP